MGWGVWDNDTPGGRDDHCGVQRSGVASVPLRGELNRNSQLCGVWSLGFRGRCLLARAGILADFVSLANWTFVHAVAPLTEPGNKEVFSIHRRGGKAKQSPEQCSAINSN